MTQTLHGLQPPSPWIERFAPLLAPGSRVLDLACGAGRHMRLMRSLGHQTLGVDQSSDALALARAHGEVLQADLEQQPWPLAGRTFEAVLVTHYLWRPLWPHLLAAIAPGGFLFYETFAQGNGTVGKPSRPDFLLQPGELLQQTQGLRVIAYEDGFESSPERFIQRIVAVRETPAPVPRRYALDSPGLTGT